MNIKPFLAAAPTFPPDVLGKIMSAYYGGRAEVHIRRQTTPVIHCDFLSMYPTVCTLMGLWRFVIAEGMMWADATDDVRQFVETCNLDQLREQATWRQLTCIVQILPDEDVFPVRARYDHEQAATIGLNHLTSPEPLWFTLADVLAAKFLGGKTPKIVSALRFAPGAQQSGLRPIEIAGKELHPAKDDFYRDLIVRRRAIQAAEKVAGEADKPILATQQQSLKILANSTSYGIFVELNVERLERPKPVAVYGYDGTGLRFKSRVVEKPGWYFHPLLGTLITGAARLMLALAERNALDQGLGWAFCDTDSLAIANPENVPTDEFIRRVEVVTWWFEPLNPYGEERSILQFEKVNYPERHTDDRQYLRPVNCLAISAKRYVLFDRDADGTPIVRKASAHGLGHLIAPYPDPEKGSRVKRIAVELWQEDLWKAIIAADDAGTPNVVNYGALHNFDQPAATRYAATNQTLLGWFSAYNQTAAERDQVRPFNFLISYQPRSVLDQAATAPEDVSADAWYRQQPKPVSRYSTNPAGERPPVFDRTSGKPVPWTALKSYRRALVRHHMHPEMKFRGGSFEDRGVLRRRHVEALLTIMIGKEADNLEERETFGDDEDAVKWGWDRAKRDKLVADIEETLKEYRISGRSLSARAGVSHHTLARLKGGGRADPQTLLNLVAALETLRQEAEAWRVHQAYLRACLRRLAESRGSVATVAAEIGLSRQHLGRVLKADKSVTAELGELIVELVASLNL